METTRILKGLGRAAALTILLLAMPAAARGGDVNDAFPPIRAKALDGTTVRVPAAEGWTVVVFWASWCPPCLAKLGDYDRLRRDLADRQVLVVGIGQDTDPREVARTAKKYGVRFPVLHAPGGRANGTPAVSELPLALVIDPQGTVRFAARGGPRDLDRIHAIVARPPAGP
jgi:peroxiredoxin